MATVVQTKSTGTQHFVSAAYYTNSHTEDIWGKVSHRQQTITLGRTLCGLQYYYQNNIVTLDKDKLCKTCLRIYTKLYADRF